jgi:dephospho-CoA kinase
VTLTIVSGSPGAGKTTLARALALGSDRGVHIASDLFYSFPVAPIDPTTPESNAQNGVIVRAIGAAAHVFATGGYAVFVDGIVGPWFVPALLECFSDDTLVSYVLLWCDPAVARERVREREGPGQSPRALQMNRAFSDPGRYAAHRIDTTALTREQLLEQVRAGLAKARFRIRARG